MLNSFYLLIPTYLLSLPASLFPLVTSWFSIEDKRIYCDGDLVSCFTERASLIAQMVKNPPAMQETPVRVLGQEDPLEK